MGMEKSGQAFRTIGEVAELLDVPQHVLRFWETKFPQIKPLKRGGRRRYYRPEDITLLGEIRALLYTQGFTIKGVQKVLRDRRSGENTAVATASVDAAATGTSGTPEANTLSAVLAELEDASRTLRDALEAA